MRDSPTGDPDSDVWKGPNDYDNEAFMFVVGDPNLLDCVARGSMPASKRSAASLDSATFRKACEHIRDGLERLRQKKAGFTQEHYESCLRMLELLEIPNEQDISYQWPVEVPALYYY